MKLWIKTAFLLSLPWAITCTRSSSIEETPQTMKTIQTSEELKSLPPLAQIRIAGTLVQEPFMNKNKIINPNILEWYLLLTDGYRIYLRYDQHIREQLLQYKNQKVWMKGSIHFGQVDSEDPNVQSRVGYILQILSLEADH